MKKLCIIAFAIIFSAQTQAFNSTSTISPLKVAQLCTDCDGSCKPRPGELL